VHPFGTPGFDELAPEFPALPGRRAIIDVAVTRVTTSCGFSIPQMELVGDRDRLIDWAEKRGEQGIVDYWASKNAASVDGLPGIST
jgi:hypothetical protein